MLHGEKDVGLNINLNGISFCDGATRGILSGTITY